MSPHKHLKQLGGPEKHSEKLRDLLKAREEIQRAVASKNATAERPRSNHSTETAPVHRG